jgi:AcrR family transcriptional regulator
MNQHDQRFLSNSHFLTFFLHNSRESLLTHGRGGANFAGVWGDLPAMNATHPAIHCATTADITEPGRPRARRTRDRAGKQQALLDAALHLFAEKGYESTTTREIASAAGCAEGLIHRYFNGKSGLLASLVEERVLDEVGDLSGEVRPAATLAEEVLQLVDWEVERKWRERDFLRVFIRSAMVDPAASEVMERVVVSLRTKVILERLRRYPAGTQLSSEELETLAQTVGMLGFIFGFMRPIVLGQNPQLAKEMAARVASLLVRGL